MGVRFPSVSSFGVGFALPGSNAETVIYTVGPMVLPLDGAIVYLFWHFTALAGTGTTAFAFRIRRGSTVSAPALNINPNSIPIAAGANGLFSGVYQDTPGAGAGLLYSLTLTQVGATASAINADGGLVAFAL